MTIRELITLMKSKHHGVWNGTPIDESKTRDKILYGNGKTLHFKKFGQENTLSSKSLINGSQFALLEKVLKNILTVLI